MRGRGRRLRFQLLGQLSRWAIHLLGLTCVFEVSGIEKLTQSARNNKCILMFWHNRLSMIAEILYRRANHLSYVALISNSRDAELINSVVTGYQNGRCIRVKHNRRSLALKTLINEMKCRNDVVIMTPDGPRGPIYTVKPGIVLAARKTGASIIPLTWKASRFWKLPTWDGLILPKPFSKIQVKFGTPIQIQPETNIKEETKKLETTLKELQN